MRDGSSWMARLGAPLRPVVTAVLTGKARPPQRRTGFLRPRRVDRLLPFHEIDPVVVADLALTTIMYASTVAMLTAANGDTRFPYSLLVIQFVVAASTLPLLLRTRWPLAAWRLSLIGAMFAHDLSVRLVADPFTASSVITCLLSLYAVAVRCTRETLLGAIVVTVVVLGFLAPNVVLGGAVLVSAVALLGYNIHVRRQTQTELADSERRHEDERAVLEERARIARELHDVVAHHMSVIAIQAEAAPLRWPDMPGGAKANLVEIRATALEALTETRRILGVLRHGEGTADTAPQPGLDRLDDLVANARATGLEVSVAITGTPRPMPPGVDLSAYRIVQESLSNAMRHAPASAVRVSVVYEDRAVAVRVENDAPPGGTPTVDLARAKHGLVGMRERAAMLGGHVSTGPTPAGGFAVAATLPEVSA